MTYYLSVFTPLLALIKVGALCFGRLYIVKQLDPPMIACNFNLDTLYAVDMMGLVYVGLFAAQLIITSEAVRITCYEGAIHAEIFPIKQTTCRSILTCCHKTPDHNIFAIEEENKPADNENDLTTSPLKKELEMSSTKKKGKKGLTTPDAHDRD